MTEDLQKSLQLINSTFEMLQDKDLVDLDLREELLQDLANEAGKSLVKFNTIEELIGETLAVQKIKYMLAAKVKSKCRLSALQGTQKPLKNAASRYKSVPLEAGNRITEHLGIILSQINNIQTDLENLLEDEAPKQLKPKNKELLNKLSLECLIEAYLNCCSDKWSPKLKNISLHMLILKESIGEALVEAQSIVQKLQGELEQNRAQNKVKIYQSTLTESLEIYLKRLQRNHIMQCRLKQGLCPLGCNEPIMVKDYSMESKKNKVIPANAERCCGWF